MRVVWFALAVIGGSLFGAGGIYIGYLLGQTRYGRGKKETVQTLFTHKTF